LLIECESYETFTSLFAPNNRCLLFSEFRTSVSGIKECAAIHASSEEVNPQAVRMVNEVVLADKPIAVQHAAIIILAKAGALQGD
jgi:hypothetical protein